MGRLDGRTALITGGAQGIGRATAALFVEEGAQVVIADIDDELGEKVAHDLGERVEYRHLDVTDPEDWITTTNAVVNAHDKLDILVNNAGVSPAGSIADASYDQWKTVNRINADSTFLGCKYAVETMKEFGGGSIVNLSSIVGIRAAGELAAYSASKGSVRLLTKSVALHAGPFGIRCNSVHPGGVETRMLSEFLDRAPDAEAARTQMHQQYPLRRWGQPEDIAKAILYLASDDSSWVTGAELVVDGGSSL